MTAKYEFDDIHNAPPNQLHAAVNSSVLGTLKAHSVAGDHEETRMQPLLDFLEWIAAPSVLIPLCKNIVQDRRFIDYAYLHNNGFFVLYIVDPDLGLQVRLHVWVPDRPPHHEQPHRHRMGFVSRVIAGELASTLYERTTVGTDGSEPYEALSVAGPTNSDFANARSELESGPTVGLRAVGCTTYRAGETYRFPAKGIHRVDTSSEFASPIITLTVWEPAFQPSIAFEPASDATQARLMNVQRLDPEIYVRMMRLVMTTISAQA